MKSATYDPSRRLDLYFRCNRAGSKTFKFYDESDVAVNVSGYNYSVRIYEYEGADDPVITLTSVVGGAGSNELTSSITVSQSNINEGKYYWELYKGSTDKTHINGTAIFHNGKFDGVSSDTEEITINDGGNDVTITLEGEFTDEIPVVTFNTELTFDSDKDLATVSGGTRTFTLAASGHKNGVGIVARINDPVAVNFPAGFEAVSGSDSISTTDMNIIMFRYFDNYDGSGTDKVLYTIKNQTSV
jgi:hypothetical protein